MDALDECLFPRLAFPTFVAPKSSGNSNSSSSSGNAPPNGITTWDDEMLVKVADLARKCGNPSILAGFAPTLVRWVRCFLFCIARGRFFLGE